jgi:hypothetical protein
MITEIIPYLIVNSMIVFGVYTLFHEDMVFGAIGDKIRSLGDYTQEKYNIDVSKPLVSCPMCMASFWGTLFFFIFTGFTVVYLVPYLIALVGLNTVVNAFI